MKLAIEGFKKLNKFKKRTCLIPMFILLASFLAMLSMIVWLSIAYQDVLWYVNTNFSIGGAKANEIYYGGADIILGKDPPTFGELYLDMGQDAFTWFYLNLRSWFYIIPYIILPLSGLSFIISGVMSISNYRSLFTPVKKIKNKKVKVEKIRTTKKSKLNLEVK